MSVPDSAWQQLFAVVSRLGAYVRIRWIDSPWVDPFDGTLTESTGNDAPIEIEYVGATGIADGGFVGGPFPYSHIAVLDIPERLTQGAFWYTQREELVNDMAALRSQLQEIAGLNAVFGERVIRFYANKQYCNYAQHL